MEEIDLMEEVIIDAINSVGRYNSNGHSCNNLNIPEQEFNQYREAFHARGYILMREFKMDLVGCATYAPAPPTLISPGWRCYLVKLD